MAPALDHVDDEMHELNQEADYLDQTFVPSTNGMNGTKHRTQPSVGGDLDAQAQVIASLRAQLDDYFGQITQLNGKLIKSYDRISDLEDQNHVKETQIKQAGVKITQLEAERTEHLSALSTGLLVEKANVTSELTRLMEKATEEAARAGEAESARAAIEKDLDDLSAGLFDQANTMVAEARLARARSERKVEETEKALRGAEEIVGLLQTQMQSLQAEKEAADHRVIEMRAVMGKGKWVDRSAGQPRTTIRLLSLHAPYAEFLQFIAHLRTIRPSMQSPPAMSTLLPLPFLARLASEDSEPTIRLDLAPSLNWLTRRSVLSAIHVGQLTVEPMATTTLMEEFMSPSIPGHSHTHVVCALCGTSVIESPTSPTRPPPQPISPTRANSQGKSSWGPSFLKTSLVQTISNAPFVHSISRPGTPPISISTEPPAQVYIFKLETTSSSGLPVSLPQGGQQKPTVYPLCTSGWCLARLRTTCSLWAFVRTGVVERIWEDEPFVPPSRTNSPRISGTDSAEVPSTPSTDAAKRARMGIGALWGTVSRSLSNNPTRNEAEKSSSEAASPKAAESPKPTATTHTVPPIPPRRLPPPPPRHPPLPTQDAPVSPPPLPKRNRPVPPPPPPRTPTTATAEEAEKPKAPVRTISEESQEDFTTPTEEAVHPPLSRPLSPTTIPLPDSEPSSPHLAAEPSADDAEIKTTEPPALELSNDEDSSPKDAPPTAVPSNTVITEQAAPAETSVTDAEPSSESHSTDTAPAPPPLPRRAANRARPTSLQPPPTVPAAPDAESQQEGLANPEGKVDSQMAVDKPSEEEPTLHDLPPPAADALRIAQDSKDETGSTLSHNEDGRQSPDLVTVSSNGPSELTEQGLRESSDTASAVEDSLRHYSDIENDSELKLEEELDPRVYVGDSTWEERTWKELVRLREDMFWARIGGLR
ncbi:hypothetical protein EIP86_006842 [Pleurotus ostreatoroseus]|nr:hypothetical protein EIP86_006842 [Pleurotus ostreatoroseus]